MKALATLAILGCTVVALAVPTVTLTLQSSKNGQTVPPATTIDWTVQVAVSTGDNDGLALFGVDLAQDANNPAKFDLPPGDPNSLDVTMKQLSRPLGISNPGEGGATTGYIGVKRGTSGQMNLIQIGGGQNTFGQAGSSMGTDFNVQAGIGQSGAQNALSGSFPAPSTEGVYTYRLQNGFANVLNTLDPDPVPPAFWPVGSATVDVTGGSISFTVGTAPPQGACCAVPALTCTVTVEAACPSPNIWKGADTVCTTANICGCKASSNCDLVVSWRDIDYFVSAQNDAISAWFKKFLPNTPSCSYWVNDVNNDNHVSWRDITPFVQKMNMTCPHP